MPTNIFISELNLTWADFIALLLFSAGWASYVWFATWYSLRVPSLQTSMDRFRREWMVQMIARDNRMVDVNVMRTIGRSLQFFASTTLLIMGALVASMSYVQQAQDLVQGLPFTVKASARLLEIKMLLLERQLEHGSYAETARISQLLKMVLHTAEGWNKLSHAQQEALDMDAVKNARILSGNPDSAEHWKDKDGKELHPHTNYYVGGNTKFYGAALFRLRREDFGEIKHAGGISPAWPISYDELAPYYLQAEKQYCVHGTRGEDPTEPADSNPFPHPAVSHEPRIQELSDEFTKQGLKPFHTPLGVMLRIRWFWLSAT